MVENPVKACVELVDSATRKNVGLRDRDIPPVVGDVLCARKGTLLGESDGYPSRYERRCLIIAEARKHGILAGKVVIYPHIKLAFVQLPHGNVRKVNPRGRVACIAGGIQVDHPFSGHVKHVDRDLVASHTCWLYAASSRVKGISRHRIALEGREVVQIDQIGEPVFILSCRKVESVGTRHAKRIQAKIPILHRRCWNRSHERGAVPLPFCLVIREKEGFVLLDWTAYRATELVQVELFFG